MRSLWNIVASSGLSPTGQLLGHNGPLALADLAGASALGVSLEVFDDRSVLLCLDDHFHTAIAMLELDGIARRIVLCTPDLSREALSAVAVAAEADRILVDTHSPIDTTGLGERQEMRGMPVSAGSPPDRTARRATQWILLTSGTTGIPKLVEHSLETLAGGLPQPSMHADATVWSTFYDIRRYGGLQIFLRAIIGGGPMLLTAPGESTREFLSRAGAAGVTHMSGTPSHWRKALMSGATALIRPRYVRLSGEVADQALLDSLHAGFPDARIVHAFASTEGGLAFEVDDGLAGFPAHYLDGPRAAVNLKVESSTLRVRSARVAIRYLGPATLPIRLDDGFVDTGDLIEHVGDRCYFRGREGGVINVGGLKVYPEEVEATLNADSRVRMSLVRGRRNPITGALVVAEVVLADAEAGSEQGEQIAKELLGICRRSLAPHKVPTVLRIVPALNVSAAGKLVRSHA